MSFGRLLVRSLLFRWKANLAVLAGCAVGASVLTGALLVGDSMRGSLRAMTEERLGRIDLALVGSRFFGQDLGVRMAEQKKYQRYFEKPVAVLLIRGSVWSPEKDGFSPRTNLIGTTPGFWKLFPQIVDPQTGEVVDPQILAKEVLVNEELARKLGIELGDQIIARVEKSSPIPRESLMSARDERSLGSLTKNLDRMIPTINAGRFSLENTQRLPKNLYVPIAMLASALEQEGRANALLLTRKPETDHSERVLADELLKVSMGFSDYGLHARRSEEFAYIAIESRRQVIDKKIAEAVERTGLALGASIQPVLTYLANTIAGNEKEIPYSIVTALDANPDPPLESLPTEPADTDSKKDEILLNQWAESQLSVKFGDPIRLDFYVVRSDGGLEERSHDFHLAGTVAMDGIALDQDFTPKYPGITDSISLTDWNPPFPLVRDKDQKLRPAIDKDRLRDVDEKYWDDYRTAPKAFIRLEDGQRLWTTRFGSLTSIRLAARDQDLETLETKLRTELLGNLTPADIGLAFHSVKSRDLSASKGSTDFDVLFVLFSMFLIASAALLVGLLFRLDAERRASQIGLLLAVGVPVKLPNVFLMVLESLRHEAIGQKLMPKLKEWARKVLRLESVRILLLAEGSILAGVGSSAGLVGALLYARLMIAMLSAQWQKDVQMPFIDFHWSIGSMAIGWFSSVLVAMLAIWWSVARLGKVTVPQLLHPGFTFASGPRGSRDRWSPIIAGLGLVGGIASMAASPLLGQVGAFFGAGALLLIGTLGFFSTLLRREEGSMIRGGGTAALTKLGFRNAGRYPARSVLTAGSIAFATFIVVSVGAMRHGQHGLEPDKESGNGGFALLGESSTPLLRDLNDPDGRFDLNVTEETEKLLADSEVHQFRVRSGDDASCLNVFRPDNPTVFGVGEAFVLRGGFAFAGSLAETDAEKENPWLLLEKETDEDTIPAIGDLNSLLWILKVDPMYVDPVGKTFAITNKAGEKKKLKIVAALSGSMFQGQLLISEKNFLELFPDIVGYEFFVVETKRKNVGELASKLQKELVDYGVEVTTTASRIAAYKAVEHTYMGAFQTLGGLGLLLGTLGLATVLLRNVLERQGELGLLRAIGFRKLALGWLVLAENFLILVVGLLAGSLCALIAVLPQLLHIHDYSGLLPLGGTVLTVLAAGMLSGILAVYLALRTPLLTALRTE